MSYWKKLGQIFLPSDCDNYLRTHASNPLAINLSEDIYRVFYSGRDLNNKSSVGFVDIDILKRKVVFENKKAVFVFGSDETFYSHGVSIGNIYHNQGNSYILFMGWQIPKGGHWRGDIGRLQLINKDQLKLNPELPFMSTDEEDQISLSYPWVVFHEDIYKMWYGSTVTWQTENNEMLHIIKYATSKDGIHWTKFGQVIPSALGIAQAFSRPSVIIDNDGYHMWYSYRKGDGTKYRIGYSHSVDGIRWENQLNQVGIDVSEQGWDSEMICYPYVFDHKDKRYMLYNGNQFGKTGFGLAEFIK